VLVRLGAVLIAVSCLLWGVLLVVPFLPGTAAQRATRGGIVFVVAEIVWWIGVAMVGGAARRAVAAAAPRPRGVGARESRWAARSAATTRRYLASL
jgi:hypothetical protein